MNWFRFYTNVLDNPKVQKLTPPLFKVWVNLLCVARLNGGVIPPTETLSYRLRMTDKSLGEAIDALIEKRLIDVTSKGMEPHDWRGHQYESDSSTDRVRRFRKRSSSGDETLHETNGNVTASVSVSVSDSSSEILTLKQPSVNGKSLISQYAKLMEAWGKPTTSGKVFQRADVELGCQVWISLIDAGKISESNLSGIFAGLERWRNSAQWNRGMVHNVPTWLGWSKNGIPAAPRWNDEPEPMAPESEY